MDETQYDRVRNVSLELLKPIKSPTIGEIRTKVRTALKVCEAKAASHEAERLCRDIETSLNVWVGGVAALDDDEDHLEWLSETMSVLSKSRPQVEWNFWKRYEHYLATDKEKRWSVNVLRSLDRTSTAILKRLEDPLRPGKWDRRGMVVGSVQSGKTSNFIGLICKALDSGYKLVVVLTGLHNNLRGQTQFRLDDDLLGFDTDKTLKFDEGNTRIGVGRLYGFRFLRIHSLTSSNENGDFNQRVARQSGIVPGGDPILLVVKKNVSVLKNLNAWVRSVLAAEDALIHDLPLLVIDDECDQASINTKALDLNDPNYEVTAINAQIRNLLHGFEKCAYVGYTATPFASVFIHPENPHANLGDDIFPESFIINLPTPSNYIGPLEVFGIDQDDDLGFVKRDGQPVLRPLRPDGHFGVTDNTPVIPDHHDKALTVEKLPASLKEAIREFVLACAARAQRGETNVHNSMLIHVSRFQNVQDQVTELVTDELKEVQRRIRYGDGESSDNIMAEFRKMWEQDFMPTTASMRPRASAASWKELSPYIEPAASRIVIKTIHGGMKDVLDYRKHKSTGLSVIAVGGDKLSRGLTLEGLTVSYYLRATRMYDTLLQMGRWFGYKDGYADLCRIYTTPELMAWYRWITMASEELRQDFIHMESIGASPRDFGLRVRRHPGSLLITSINKMRAGTVMQVSYADTMNETLVFHKDSKIVRKNFEIVDRYVKGLGPPSRPARKADFHYTHGHVWDGITADSVTGLLTNFSMHPDARRSRPDLLANYIRKQVEQGDLSNWTVALMTREGPGKGRKVRIGGLEVSCLIRQPPGDLVTEDKIGLKRLVDPKHEAIDLSRDEFSRGLAATKEAWQLRKSMGDEANRRISKSPPRAPSPQKIRESRPSTRGLLLIYPIDGDRSGWGSYQTPVIGLAISFPASADATAIDYLVNKVYEDEQFA